MRIPALYSASRRRDILTAFGGINRGKVINDGEFADTGNLSTRNYPCLSTREKRLLIDGNAGTVRGMTAKDQLCIVAAAHGENGAAGVNRFYYAGEEVTEVTALLSASDCERTLVSMGASVVIFPDKVIYNTVTGEAKSLERIVNIPASSAGQMTATLCDESGGEYSNIIQSQSVENPENGALWLDGTGAAPVLRVFSAADGGWHSVPTTFVKIEHPMLSTADGDAVFKAYDTVEISGMDEQTLNGSFQIAASGPGWIAVTGIFAAEAEGSYGLLSEYPASGNVCIARRVPDMDFVVESENRLWGCRYGGGLNEIFACKLGDPTNWNTFSGIASDSYRVSLGTDGAFTGAAVYDSTVLFFKENFIHRVFGSKPSNFQVSTAEARGIRKGCSKSAVIVDETLYYLSKTGVVAYTGGVPVNVSQALGEEKFENAAAGTTHGRYYICMTGKNAGERCLWCLDTARMLWLREGEADIGFMASLKDDLFAYERGRLYCLNGESYEGSLVPEADEGEIEWFAETGDIGMNDCDGRYYSFIQLRFEAEKDSEVNVAFEFNSDGRWVSKFRYVAGRKRAVSVPFVTPRCDHFRIRLSGRGACVVYSLSKFIEEGGDAVRG